jgi:hypothetical protein
VQKSFALFTLAFKPLTSSFISLIGNLFVAAAAAVAVVSFVVAFDAVAAAFVVAVVAAVVFDVFAVPFAVALAAVAAVAFTAVAAVALILLAKLGRVVLVLTVEATLVGLEGGGDFFVVDKIEARGLAGFGKWLSIEDRGVVFLEATEPLIALGLFSFDVFLMPLSSVPFAFFSFFLGPKHTIFLRKIKREKRERKKRKKERKKKKREIIK